MHPNQPIITDSDGVERFKANKIIEYLIAQKIIDLNQLNILHQQNNDLTKEDFMQTMQQFAGMIDMVMSNDIDLDLI